MEDENKKEKIPYWKKLQNEHLYFVNKNIVKYGIESDNTDFTKKNKAIWILIPGGLLLVVCLGLMMFAHSVILEIPAVLASLWIYQMILRKKVFDENMYKRMNADNQAYHEMKLNGPFNNLLRIDDGQWFYQSTDKGLQTAFLVTFDYNSLLDQSLDANENTIQDGYIPFIKKLHESKYAFDLYDIEIKSDISYGVLQEIKKTKMLENGSWLQLISSIQNDTMSVLEQQSGWERRLYFLIFSNDFQNVMSFKNTLQDIINETLSVETTIVNPRICQEDDIVLFLKNYFEIESFSTDNLVRNVERLDISKYFNFVYFIDQNGARYQLSDIIMDEDRGQGITPEFINSNINQYEKRKVKEKKISDRDKQNKEKERYLQMMKEKKQGHLLEPHVPGLVSNKAIKQKTKQILSIEEKKKHDKALIDARQKEQKKNLELKKSGLNMNDSMSLNDLLSVVHDAKDNKKDR